MEPKISEEEEILTCKLTCIEGCSIFCQKLNKVIPPEKQKTWGDENTIFNDGAGHDPDQM